MDIEKLKKICEMALRGSPNEQKVARKILKKYGISNPDLFLSPQKKPNSTFQRKSRRPPAKSKTLEEAIDAFAVEMEGMAIDALEGALSRISDKFRSILK